jgi:hypothetical protein
VILNLEVRVTTWPEKWRIWSFEHHAWWAENECGYTEAASLAGTYTLERALEIVAHAAPGDEAILPAPLRRRPREET